MSQVNDALRQRVEDLLVDRTCAYEEIARLKAKVDVTWTTDPPTKPGLYWAMPTPHGGRLHPRPQPVMLADTLRGGWVVMEIGTDLWAPTKNYSHWAPLSEPVSP